MTRPGPRTSFVDLVREAARQRPTGLALVIGSERRTYADLLDRATWRARELKSLGLGAGDRLGLLLPNSVEYVELLIGAAMLGVIAVPMNIRFGATDTARIIADSGMTAIYTTDAIDEVANFRELLLAALSDLAGQDDPTRLRIPGFRHLRAIVQMGGTQIGFVDPATLRKRAFSQPPPEASEAADPDRPLVLMYTAGTTGDPKACILSSRAVAINAHAIAKRYRIGSDDVWWCPLPMFHIGGLLFLTIMFARAGLYVGMPTFSAEATFDIVERMRPTVLYPLFPSVALALIDHPRFAKTSFDSVKHVFSVAPPEVQRRIQRAFHSARLCSAYGMTETCGAVTTNMPDDDLEQRMTTVGSPLPAWQIRIVDPQTREPAEVGARGEIEVRGEAQFCGYFNDRAATAAGFSEDRYLRTGDLGSLDETGRLRFHGRLKDQSRVGGESVAAVEVEFFLAGHPAVRRAQVIGIADERHGDVAVAFVELMSGASLTEADLIGYCTGRIARFKIPRHVRFVTEWPMSGTKVLKHELRDRFAADLAPSTWVA